MKARWLSGQTSTASQPLSGATVHKHLVVLRRALAEAVRSGIIVRNPADLVPAPSVKARTERRALTEDEIKLLVAAARVGRYDLPIRFTLATGVRQGELLGLKWEDVDFDAGTVSIRRAMSYVAGKTIFTVPKTERSRRVIELSAATVHALRSHRVEQSSHRLMLGPAWHEYSLAFPSTIGTPCLARPFFADTETRSAGPGSLTWRLQLAHPPSHRRHPVAPAWSRRLLRVTAVGSRLRLVHDGRLRAPS